MQPRGSVVDVLHDDTYKLIGRYASGAAHLWIGKNYPNYCPHADARIEVLFCWRMRMKEKGATTRHPGISRFDIFRCESETAVEKNHNDKSDAAQSSKHGHTFGT